MDDQTFETLMSLAAQFDAVACQRINIWLAPHLGWEIEAILPHQQEARRTIRARYWYLGREHGDCTSWSGYFDEADMYRDLPHPTDKLNDAFTLLYASDVVLENFVLYRKAGLWRATDRVTTCQTLNPALAIVGLCWKRTPKFHVAVKG